jgi:hypothetical protein
MGNGIHRQQSLTAAGGDLQRNRRNRSPDAVDSGAEGDFGANGGEFPAGAEF